MGCTFFFFNIPHPAATVEHYYFTIVRTFTSSALLLHQDIPIERRGKRSKKKGGITLIFRKRSLRRTCVVRQVDEEAC